MSEPASGWIARKADESSVSALLAAKAEQAIHLEREIPLRASLIRKAADDHVLLVLLHHIASDGWSFAPLTADLSQAYSARSARRDARSCATASAICRLHAVAAGLVGRG